MIVQNSSSPWAVLAIIVMAGCLIAGMLAGNVGPFNTHVAEAGIPARQTQGALDSLATQSALQALQTQQAYSLAQAEIAANMTLAPMQQAAAQTAAVSTLQAVQAQATQTAAMNESYNAQVLAQATQTAVAGNLYAENLSRNATATAVAERQSQEHATGAAQIFILIVGALVVAGWIAARIAVQVMNARTREKAAQAKVLAEQQKIAALRASREAIKRERSAKYPAPRSLMKRPGDGTDLPRGE
jgi:hypothetical protein